MIVMETIKRALTWEEIKFILMIVAPVVSAMLLYSAINADLAVIKQRLDVIENNHLQHIQESIQRNTTDIREIQIDMAKLMEHFKRSLNTN